MDGIDNVCHPAAVGIDLGAIEQTPVACGDLLPTGVVDGRGRIRHCFARGFMFAAWQLTSRWRSNRTDIARQRDS